MSRSPAASLSEMPFDDLLQGMNEWRSIQEVIRNTFKALHDVIKAQGEAVKSLERQIEAKASKSDLQAALGRKANISDVNWSLAEVTRMVDSKAGIEDLERKADARNVEAALDSRITTTDIQPLLTTARDFVNFKEIVEGQIHSLSEQLAMKMDTKTCRVALDSKATTHDFSILLQSKVSREELEELLAAHTKAEALNRKSDERAFDEIRSQLQRLSASFVSKTELDDILTQQSEKVLSAVEISKQQTIKLEKRLEVIERDTQSRIQGMERELNSKITHLDSRHAEKGEILQGEIEEAIQKLQKTISSDRNNVQGEIEEVREDMDRLFNECLQQVQLFMQQAVRREDVANAISKKADAAALEDVIQDIAKIEEELLRVQQGTDDVNRSADHLALELESRADSQATAVRSMASALDELSEQMNHISKTVSSLNGSSARGEASRQLHDTRLHALEAQLARHTSLIDSSINTIQRDLVVKANVADMNIILDSKANVDDVNRSLQLVNSALEARATREEVSTVVSEQAVINAAVYSELCIARWIWQTGITKNGNMVPWNVQTLNTDPHNLQWEKDKSSILVRDPGLYEISFGFFSRKKPVIQVLVNGEAAFLVSNQQSISGNARLSASVRHSAGNVTGLTHIDFLALPAKAKISLTYSCETRAEGFLGIRKL